MTRINAGIPPKQLHNKHLLAEHREIIRIPNAVRRHLHNGTLRLDNAPPKFVLGNGHVKFFYNKLGYLLNRYRELYAECKARGYKVQNFESAWLDIPDEYMGDYEPTQEGIAIITKRISDKLESWEKLNI